MLVLLLVILVYMSNIPLLLALLLLLPQYYYGRTNIVIFHQSHSNIIYQYSNIPVGILEQSICQIAILRRFFLTNSCTQEGGSYSLRNGHLRRRPGWTEGKTGEMWNRTRTGATSGRPEMEVLKSWGVPPNHSNCLIILVFFKLWNLGIHHDLRTPTVK